MKYYLSICTIIKNERNLEEFITYYIIQGVEHFYIYDNDSTIPIKNRLNKYIFREKCTIINFSGHSMQMKSYNHCLNNYGHETKWLCIFDGDEYILPKNKFTLRDFLSDYNDFHAIGINWVFYGTSFHDKKQDGFIIDKDRYTSNKLDKHIKTICQPLFTKMCTNPHFVILNDPSKYIDPLKNTISGPFNNNLGNIEIIQLNHYYTRSLEESYEKEQRGRADANIISSIPHLHEFNNEFLDNQTADKYLVLLKDLNNKININIKIYQLLNPDLKLHLKNDNQYYNHFYKNGIEENRCWKINHKYPDFNLLFYKQNYKDLQHMTDTELELHYLNNGINENRVCSKLL